MTEITSNDKQRILQRFQQPELSYETIPHTKVSPDYNICLGIPIGTKGFAWLTFLGVDDVCFLMELNKERNISRITSHTLPSGSVFANGTLFYGTIVGPAEFVIEDIYLYESVPTKTLLFSEKLGFLEIFMKTYVGQTRFHLPVMWTVLKGQSYDCLYDPPKTLVSSGPSFHHIQYRCLTKVAPYMNVFPTKKGFAAPTPAAICDDYLFPWKFANPSKPQYRQNTIFRVRADIQFDIYRLFAYGTNKAQVYYGVTCIPNYKISVYMNGLFRNIKENVNLDAIEESDDEEDFENIDPEKYVDLQKSLLMECRYHTKFRKWVPLRVVDDRQKVVHISQL
jgi:hypothetical protein